MKSPFIWQRVASYLENPTPLLKTWKFSRNAVATTEAKLLWVQNQLPDWYQHTYDLDDHNENDLNYILTPKVTQHLVKIHSDKLPFSQVCDILLRLNHLSSLDEFFEERLAYSSLNDLLLATFETKNQMILKTVTSKFPAQSLSDIWNLVHHTLSQFNQGNRQFLEDNFDFILNWGKSVMDDNIFIISSIINFIVQNDYKIDHLNTILPFSPEHLFNVQLIHWNQFTDVQFLHLLYWSIHHNLLAIENDFVAFDLFEIILRNDLHQCLKFLLSNGLEIYDEWCLYLATSANSIQCVEMLLSIGINPHTNDDICIFDAAKYGHPRILLNFFKYWENDPILIKKILYTAIEYDQVSVIKLLFNSSSIPVKVDKYALWLAIQPRENPARDSDTNLTILQILLQHNDETKKYVIICNDKDEEVVKNYKRQRIC